MKKNNKDEGRGESVEGSRAAEAAELLSGLVAAVIILMLVVKPLGPGRGEEVRKGGGGRKKPLWLILCPPQPPDAELHGTTTTIATITRSLGC